MPDTTLGRQSPPSLNIGQGMAGHEQPTILGSPGTGKTTLLAYLPLTYAQGQAEEHLSLREKRLPILVPPATGGTGAGRNDGVDTMPDY